MATENTAVAPDAKETTEAQVLTLGEMADVLRDWHAQGITLGSINYVLDRAYWREIDEEAAARETMRAILNEVATPAPANA